MDKLALLEERRRNWVCSKEVDNLLNRSDVKPDVTNILNKLTSKISVVIKDEMKEEINKVSSSLIDSKIDKYLTQELSAYGCKICLEIMNSSSIPNRTPLILSCGHTLCKSCFELMSRKQCPLCRTVVNNHCVNISLKELIDSFLTMTKNKENICNHTLEVDITEGGQMSNFLCKISNIQNRITIIESELNQIVKENSAVKLKMKKVNTTKLQLIDERTKVEMKIKLLNEELDLIDEHLQRNNIKQDELLATEDSNELKIKMLNEILKELNGDLCKYNILYDSTPSVK